MDSIYYISQGQSPKDHLNNIKVECEAGCKLIQLRLKDVEEETLIETAKMAKSICKLHKAKLIINDNVKVAKIIDADGVHLGRKDMSPIEARKIIGPKIIGGTANTFGDCLALIEQNIDYIGIGPYRFTNTKQTLDPILGIDGIKEIIHKLKTLKHNLPIVAIGGIELEDFAKIFNAGVTSIAASNLLTNKSIERVKEIVNFANEHLQLELK